QLRSAAQLRTLGRLVEPPVQNLDSIDQVGVRKDRGIDLGLTCSSELDSSSDTLERLRQKLSGYLEAAVSTRLWEVYPTASRGPVRILIFCRHAISEPAAALIHEMTERASREHVEIVLDRGPA